MFTDVVHGSATLQLLVDFALGIIQTSALWLADRGVTVAKDAMGKQTPEELRELPQGKLRLDHSQEGLDNK